MQLTDFLNSNQRFLLLLTHPNRQIHEFIGFYYADEESNYTLPTLWDTLSKTIKQFLNDCVKSFHNLLKYSNHNIFNSLTLFFVVSIVIIKLIFFSVLKFHHWFLWMTIDQCDLVNTFGNLFSTSTFMFSKVTGVKRLGEEFISSEHYYPLKIWICNHQYWSQVHHDHFALCLKFYIKLHHAENNKEHLLYDWY